MNRRRFLGALGGASATTLAGCSDADLNFSRDGTPFENPEERIRTLQRQRAVLLYAGGVALGAAGDRAFPDLQQVPSKSEYSDAELAVYRGRASGYYDAAAWNFARAGVVLSTLDDVAAEAGVDACADARAKAYHLGLGHAFRAVATLEERFGGTAGSAPTSVLDTDSDGGTPTPDDGGMQQAGTESGDDNTMGVAGTESNDGDTMEPAGTESGDDGGMSMAPPPEDDDGTSVTGTTPAEVADAHFRRANAIAVVSLPEFRQGLTDG